MTCDIATFGLTEMLRVSTQVRRVAGGAPSMEEATNRICRFLFDEFVDGGGERQCALVRCYKTHPYGGLPLSLQRFADRALDGVPAQPATKCLTLLATVGEYARWNQRRSSRGHQAIPLVSAALVEKTPMIAQLIRQFGLDISTLLDPTPEILSDLLGKTYGVFHVADALGSPYIPAQRDFVEAYRIKSVVGFGGSLRSGDLYAIILFTRATVSREVAERFRNVALDVKSALFNYGDSELFEAVAEEA
jgi:hypothetical protein